MSHVPSIPELAVSSTVDSVEVYRSQALVTRRVKVAPDVAAGPLILELTGLPLGLLEHSVRVELPGTVDIRVVDCQLSLVTSEQEQPLTTALEAELQSARDRRRTLEIQRQREADRREYVASLEPPIYPATDLPESLAFTASYALAPWLQFIDGVRDTTLAVGERLRVLDEQLQELRGEIAALEDRLARQRQAEADTATPRRRKARLQLVCDRAPAPFELLVSYLIPGVQWVPSYELHLLDGEDRAEIAVHGLVAQVSGEDWPTARLAFSTADLQRSAALPRLASWRIGRSQPPPATGWRPLPATLDALFADYDRNKGPSATPEGSVDLPPLPPKPPWEDLPPQDLSPHIPMAMGMAPSPQQPSPPSPTRAKRHKLPGPQAAQAALMPSATRASDAWAGFDSAVDAGSEAGSPEASSEAVTASRHALAFHNLRLQGPDADARRGQLVAEPSPPVPP
ncbi:MAG: mucoidy inhibitor MuiA family protein, partial [Candidatus Competibacterales bacterium]